MPPSPLLANLMSKKAKFAQHNTVSIASVNAHLNGTPPPRKAKFAGHSTVSMASVNAHLNGSPSRQPPSQTTDASKIRTFSQTFATSTSTIGNKKQCTPAMHGIPSIIISPGSPSRHHLASLGDLDNFAFGAASADTDDLASMGELDDFTSGAASASADTSITQSRSSLEDDDEVEEWDILHVFTIPELQSSNPTKCMTAKCSLLACTTYISTQDKDITWNSCIDCQERDFGGWPDSADEFPVRYMTEEHRSVISEFCTEQCTPSMPGILPLIRIESYVDDAASAVSVAAVVTDVTRASSAVTRAPSAVAVASSAVAVASAAASVSFEDSDDTDSDQDSECLSDVEQDDDSRSIQSQKAKKAWPPITADSAISNLKDKLTVFTKSMNSFTPNGRNRNKVPISKDRYNEMIRKVGEQEDLFLKMIKDNKLVLDEHLGKYSRVLYPEYKEGHLLSLLCFSWATTGCCEIREASVTIASRLACPFFTGFCIYVDFHPFSLDYDVGKSLGLDALTANRDNTDLIIGLYHSMVIETLLPYVDVASTSSKTIDRDFGRLHAQALFSSKILPTIHMPHMELLYNGWLGHCHWDLLKEIDISATERELLFMTISYIIKNPEEHISNFNEESALCLLKKIVEDHPSCVRNIAYETFVTKTGESYNGIKGIRRAHGSKGGKATQDTRDENFENHCSDLVIFNVEKGHCNVPQLYPANQAMANWLHNIKAAYNEVQKGNEGGYDLSPDRIERLEAIGLQWNIHDAAFEKHCSDLITYTEEVGDCNVPQRYSANPSLGRWCKEMRGAYKKIQKGQTPRSNLSQKRIERLNEIGFLW